MNISDLIATLQQKMKEHGDLPIATPGEHYDQFDDGAAVWIGYKPMDEVWGYELACDEELEYLTDEELENSWNVSDRNSLTKMLFIS